ncbi:MAG: DNA repair protein RecN [Bacteroidales bacterium]|nr:DNA repair protein RecN [Bacteroidales bacterium]
MLVSLKIENYALIRSSCINFNDGFSAVTGETGAGKSIMMGALSLVLGERADTQVLTDKNSKCVIEAVFSLGEDMKEVFEANDLDFDTSSVFRREITPSGKSRAFINDTPVQLSVMKSFADVLVDIHSQSSTVKLCSHAYQLSIVDSLLEDRNLLACWHKEFSHYRLIQKSIEELEERQNALIKEESYNRFLFEELDKANLQDGEQEEDERLAELYANSGKIKENITESLSLLDNEQDNNIIGMLNETNYRLEKIASHNQLLAELYSRLKSASIELKDIYAELNSFNDGLDFDSKDMEQLTQRLNVIYDLERKHNVKTIAELLVIKDDLQKKLSDIQSFEWQIDDLYGQKRRSESELDILSAMLTDQRKQAAEFLSQKVKPLLNSMAMKDAVFQVEITQENGYNANGNDKVRFLFNANKTKDNQLQDLSDVISGGELSRLMLAVKTVIASKYSVDTLIFDEIDTGISGDIASKVADIMRTISQDRQVIAITHLVQVAAKADNQYKVYKQIVDNQTQSNVSLLTHDQRIEELAKMLSGDKVTKEAVANAK